MSEKLIIGASNSLCGNAAKIKLHKMILYNVQVFPVLCGKGHMGQHL